jgi:2,3-bisphosphoglycerate-independent phosphoglycerate mutase
MRAPEIADAVLKELASDRFRFLRLNFANGDMVGHTGDLAATIAAVEAVDTAIGRLVEPVLSRNGALVITADHGNADDMAEWDKKTKSLKRDEKGQLVPKTAHSLNPVVFHVVLPPPQRSRFALAKVDEPGLGNIAATLATLLGFAPAEHFLPSLVRPQ